MDINDGIRRLARARIAEAQYREEGTRIENELAATFLGERLNQVRTLLKVARADLADAEDRVRSEALQLFGETGDRQPHPAVRVVMTTEMSYADGDALAYCRGHLPTALKLDKKVFEKVAKAIGLDFVVIDEVPATRIDRDLSAYLEEGKE